MTRSPHRKVEGVDHRVSPEEIKHSGWKSIFRDDENVQESLVVEIGFGRGEFLVDLARRNSNKAHIGIDLSWKRVAKMARRLASCPVRNLRLIEGNAKEVVEYMLDDGSVETFWINFPDPWPKRRHSHRRLIKRDFLDVLVTKLIPEGTLEVATDHPAYANWINARLQGTQGLQNLYTPYPYLSNVPGRHLTAYEEIWRLKGRTPYFWRYKKVAL